MEFKIANKKIGDQYPCFIVAELSSNHCQKYDLAVKTIKAIAKAGADAVKLQTYTSDSLSLNIKNKYFPIAKEGLWKGMTDYQVYQKAFTPWDWQPKLKKLAESLGLICFSAPYDNQAVEFCAKMKMPAYKVGSPEIIDMPLIEHMALQGKPMIISTGVANLNDINLAVKTCKNQGNNQIVLLKCSCAYPTPLEELNLNNIIALKKKFKTIVGLSDHTLSSNVALAAVVLGARLVEKHFILDRKLPSQDKDFSLEPAEFKNMVESIREVEKALGRVNYQFTANLQAARKGSRSLFVVKDIKRRGRLTSDNIRSIRPGDGLAPKYFKKVLTKKAKKDLKKGTPLKWKDLQNL